MDNVELIALSDIGAAGNDFAAIIMILVPRNDYRGVEPTRLCEYDFVYFSHDKNLFSYNSFPII